MTIRIHRILKEDLSLQNSFNIVLSGMSNSSSMTISHYPYAPKQTESTIPYEIEIVREYVPKIKQIDHCVVIRKKIDLTGTGVNGKIIEDIGDDVGEYLYTDKVPPKPNDLPPGFVQFYKG